MSRRWGPLVVLGLAQFVMVLDQAVMNVSVSQLVEDFDTSVPVIQGVITLYSLVMAMLMVTGGRIGDRIGRKRAFTVGLVVYAAGSALTAASWSVATLALGWSVLEGIGAALVLPALASLIAGNYRDGRRRVAYAVIGGVAGAGIAVGPIVGGWMTTEASWRYVFVGEVVLVLAILASLRLLADAVRPGRAPELDRVGAVLSSAGLGLVVVGILQSSTWGWLRPKQSPVEPFGFALTPFVVGAGAATLWAFVQWQRRRVEHDRDPLIHLELFRIPALRSGIITFVNQNLILMGVFFALPLYLQLVQGLDALQTGIRMLPVSVTMFVTSAAGSALAARFAPRTIVRAGFAVMVAAVIVLLSTIEPTLDGVTFGAAMALLGCGMGLIASQLGNVVQSSVDESGRGEAGGLQYTAQQLGSSLGVALIGAIVLSGLTAAFVRQVEADPRVDDELARAVGVEVADGVEFVPASTVSDAIRSTDLDPASADALVDSYRAAQLQSLEAGLLVVAGLALVSLAFTRGLPSERPRPSSGVGARDGPAPGRTRAP